MTASTVRQADRRPTNENCKTISDGRRRHRRETAQLGPRHRPRPLFTGLREGSEPSVRPTGGRTPAMARQATARAGDFEPTANRCRLAHSRRRRSMLAVALEKGIELTGTFTGRRVSGGADPLTRSMNPDAPGADGSLMHGGSGPSRRLSP